MELKEILEYINIIHNPYMLKSCIMDVLQLIKIGILASSYPLPFKILITKTMKIKRTLHCQRNGVNRRNAMNILYPTFKSITTFYSRKQGIRVHYTTLKRRRYFCDVIFRFLCATGITNLL